MKSVADLVREFEVRTGSIVDLKLMKLGGDKPIYNAITEVFGERDGKKSIRILINHTLSAEYANILIEKELRGLEEGNDEQSGFEQVLEQLIGVIKQPQAPVVALSTFIIPERDVPDGVLVKSAAAAWQSMVEDLLGGKWHEVYNIDPRLFEEIIAGAFERSRLYDEVILTPRSGDKGRDIIAIKNGFSGFRVIGSVKRYAPGRLIKRAEVDELVGTLFRDSNASKGILTTTSDFAPGVLKEPSFGAMMPNRLELVNGEGLKKLFKELLNSNPVK